MMSKLISEEDMYWISYAWHQGHRLDAYEDSNRPHCENEDGTLHADRMGRLEEALEQTDWFSKMQAKYDDNFLDWHYDNSAEDLDALGYRKEVVTAKMVQYAMEASFGHELGDEEE
tara:strand:+ start:1457 stop:1804 length:348 start_codon:yes stop_codon:yes gene_type:complete